MEVGLRGPDHVWIYPRAQRLSLESFGDENGEN